MNLIRNTRNCYNEVNSMHRLNLSDYALVILLLVALALGLSYGLQQWLTQVSSETGARIERASKEY